MEKAKARGRGWLDIALRRMENLLHAASARSEAAIVFALFPLNRNRLRRIRFKMRSCILGHRYVFLKVFLAILVDWKASNPVGWGATGT